MRILFFDDKLPGLLKDADAPAGGATVQILTIIRALAQAGHSVGVLVLKGDARVANDLCELIETYDPAAGLPKLRLLTNAIPALLAAARAFRPDAIVQSCSGRHTGLLAFVASSLGVPFVHRIAADIDSDGRSLRNATPIDALLIRYGMGKADLVLCQNGFQLDAMRNRYPGKRLLLMRNALPVALDPAPLRGRAARSYVAWVGNFRRVKNLGLLHEVARALPEFEFRVAGLPVPGMDEETGQSLKALKGLDNVRMVGHLKRSAVPEFMSRAVAILCTSDHEGFPNTFLEALSAGTPVVTRRGVDPDSFIERNGLGRVADNEGLVQGLRDIWTLDLSDYEDLGRRCRAYVETNHSPETIAERLTAEIRALRPAANAA